MIKVLFGITSLTLGGAERVLVDLTNALCNKYDITIFTIYANGELEKQLNKKVKLKSLVNKSYEQLSYFQKHISMPIKVLLGKSKIYNENIRDNYDTQIAFLEGPITRIFSVKNDSSKKIAWVHNDISQVFGNNFKSKIKKLIDKKIYSKYEKLIFVSKDNLENFNKAYPNINIKKEVIYNYIDAEKVLQKAKEKQDTEFNDKTTNFVTVTRLVKQKGIDRLMKVHERLIESGYNHEFYVIGDGSEKENLQKIVKEKNIESTFHLLGKKENPYPFVKNADYFCLLSYFEGYGMVLEEAKMLNKSIIITNTAAREAIANYVDSTILENSEDGIYEGLKEVIQSKNKVQKDKMKEVKEYDNSLILERVKKIIEK